MSALALQLIAKNKQTKETFLDLGNCGLRELPNELFKCIWLEGLNLGEAYRNKADENTFTINEGAENVLGPETLHELQQLTNLNSLFLRKTGTKYLYPLAGLVNLQQLSLGRNQISNLSPLEGLRNLKHLYLGNNQITDINALAGLVNLEGLFVSNNQIKDAGPLKLLVNLRNLNMTANKISSLGPLSALVNIKQLSLADNRIGDLQPLTSLLKLQKLDLSYNRIEDIRPLARLFDLKKLDLTGNWISDVSSLNRLVNLRELVLARNQITHIDEDWLDTLPTLEDLFLMENNIANLPGEIYYESNCLYNKKNFFKDKAKGTNLVYEAKLILVGNGRVGKTSLVNRLLDNSFNPDEPSTHAIQLREWELSALAEETGLQKLKVNIWDFGGQDIYHATHRLFMNAKAVFLLVWDQQTLKETSQTEMLQSGRLLSFQNYVLQYWLSYIKSLSGNSPVLVVQSKMAENGKISPPLTDEEKRKYNVRNTLSIDSGMHTANGFRSLRASIEEVLTEQIQDAYTEIPSLWYAVREKVGTLQKQQIQRLALVDFKRICEENKLDESSTKTLLSYLHNTGVFFYRDGLFGNQIVLDQRWVIDAVYSLFDRKGSFSRMHGNGMFSGLDLLEIWVDRTSGERKLFVSFMLECEICFEVNSSESADKGLAFSESMLN